MPEHDPHIPFGFRLPTDVAARIRATTPTAERPRPRRLPPMVRPFDDRSVN